MDFGVIAIAVGFFVLSFLVLLKFQSNKNAARKGANNFALKGPTIPVLFKLREVIPITHNTKIYRFSLPSPTSRLGLPVGKHFTTHAVINGEEVSRPYTPTTSDHERGYVDLLIKVYPNGVMSRHIDSLKVGDNLQVQGPKGMLAYLGRGRVKISGKNEQIYTSLNMVCGGTGITPMLQVIRAILRDTNDTTSIRLIFGNVTEEDILLREELGSLSKDKRFSVFLTLDKPPQGWTQGSGFVTEAMMRERLFEPSPNTLCLFCGPPPMVNGGKATMEKMGYSKDNIFSF
eukprot:c4589_g1_i1.p1 GENE.c4589_g1_i1~~c4589_g1_i1.p1  ORF type:complete len:303 (+),score=65.95 c4589_g1_i1:46-909(+)